MKLISTFLLFFSFVNCSNQTENKSDLSQSKSEPHQLFKIKEAERILGEAAHLNDSTLSVKDGVTIYNCDFTANSIDEKTGKTGSIYFMLEIFSDIKSAKDVYSSIKKANEPNGIKVLDGIGDEAYFHSDNENFYFILSRKAGKLLRMKVNKITSHTSLDEFNKVTYGIVDKL